MGGRTLATSDIGATVTAPAAGELYCATTRILSVCEPADSGEITWAGAWAAWPPTTVVVLAPATVLSITICRPTLALVPGGWESLRPASAVTIVFVRRARCMTVSRPGVV